MSDLPTREELIEIASGAAWFEYIDTLGWPNDQPTWKELSAWGESHADDTRGIRAMKEHRDLIRAQAIAILDAILPRVLEGVVEALGPFSDAADGLDKCRDDRPLWAALTTGFSQRDKRPLSVADLRRARSVRQWAEKMRGK